MYLVCHGKLPSSLFRNIFKLFLASRASCHEREPRTCGKLTKPLLLESFPIKSLLSPGSRLPPYSESTKPEGGVFSILYVMQERHGREHFPTFSIVIGLWKIDQHALKIPKAFSKHRRALEC